MKDRFETFTVLINRISRNIRRIKNQEMAKYDLKSAHISCLYFLYHVEGLTATELCERCEEDKATISRALDHLETVGYLTCDCKHAKRYKSALKLTDEGFRIGGQIAEKVDRILEEVGGCLQEEERESFYRCLAVISDHLETIGNGKK